MYKQIRILVFHVKLLNFTDENEDAMLKDLTM